MTFVGPDSRTGHVVRLVAQRLGPGVLEASSTADGEDVLVSARERLLVLLHLLRDDPDADMRLLLDVTAVDHGRPAPRDGGGDEHVDQPERPRFDVLYRLRSPRLGYRALVIVPVTDIDPVVPSATELFPAAEWYERELWEMCA